MSITHAPPTHIRRPHLNPWLAAVIALGVAVVALGTWVIVDQTRSSSAQGQASPEVAAMIHNLHAAMNRYDAKAVVAFYSQNGVMDEIDAGAPRVVSRGHDQLLARYRYMLEAARSSGIQDRVGTITQVGSYLSMPVSYGTPGTTLGQGFVIEQLDANGKIAHEWVITGAP
jgi:hypothetical protein